MAFIGDKFLNNDRGRVCARAYVKQEQNFIFHVDVLKVDA